MPYTAEWSRPDFFANLRGDPRFDDLVRRVLKSGQR